MNNGQYQALKEFGLEKLALDPRLKHYLTHILTNTTLGVGQGLIRGGFEGIGSALSTPEDEETTNKRILNRTKKRVLDHALLGAQIGLGSALSRDLMISPEYRQLIRPIITTAQGALIGDALGASAGHIAKTFNKNETPEQTFERVDRWGNTGKTLGAVGGGIYGGLRSGFNLGRSYNPNKKTEEFSVNELP